MADDLTAMIGLAEVGVLADGLDHPEGVAWGPDGYVYAGGEAGQLYRVSVDGAVEQVADTAGFVLGVTLDGAGRVYGCDMARREVVRFDPAAGRLETYSVGTAERPLRNPNVAVFDSAGNLYVTDSGTFDGDDGVIFRVAPGGATELWTDAVPRFPNGACLDVDGRALLVVESLLPGVSRVPILADGSAGTPEIVAELPGHVPDGIAIDVNGAIYVGCYRPDRILRISATGAVEMLVDDPRGTTLAAPTNLAFVGSGLDRLAIASLGRWHLGVVDVHAEGHRLEYPDVS
ncbi:MAG TPA: SMP-30/gluconolactonase/LRE family protein [Ilumatobacter sp.]|nr:SMP-30/gluconolactonase/LRE family protein [Ilumatobacter sp.]